MLDRKLALFLCGRGVMTLGKKIRNLREAANLSQTGLEKRTGLKREYLSKLENGKLGNPTIRTLRRIAGGLKVDIVALLTDDPQILTIIERKPKC